MSFFIKQKSSFVPLKQMARHQVILVFMTLMGFWSLQVRVQSIFEFYSHKKLCESPLAHVYFFKSHIFLLSLESPCLSPFCCCCPVNGTMVREKMFLAQKMPGHFWTWQTKWHCEVMCLAILPCQKSHHLIFLDMYDKHITHRASWKLRSLCLCFGI